MIKDFLKEFNLTKAVFIALGLVFGFVPMLTEKEAEYNLVFAFLACTITCAFLEGMRAVMVKPKPEDNEKGKEEKKKVYKPRYDWRNVVLALVATAVSVVVCVLL